MRYSSIIWGLLLILTGVLFLLNSLGILAVNIWAVLWPSALILFGLAALAGAFRHNSADAVVEGLALQLKGYEEAAVTIHFGGGRLELAGGAPPDELLSGTFGGGVIHHLDPDGEVARVALRATDGLPPGEGREWAVALNEGIPLTLTVNSGASEALLDLTSTQLRRLDVHTGAGRVELDLPAAAGQTAVNIEGGAGEVIIRVPEGVAARVSGGAVLGRVDVDETRFLRVSDGWQSDQFETAANRAEITVRFGAGRVQIS